MDGVRSRGGSVYCIGIGGVMMASLAILTARAGFPVSGSDRAFAGGCDSPTAQRLTAAGIRLFGDHAAAHLPPDCGAVIYTVAITEDNPEYRAAAERGIPRFSRADYIGWLMTGYNRRVGVAGMHGKSTCTSMCAQVFLDAAADPTVLIGADYPPIGGAFRLGGREMFLFEACEYMDSFLDFRPTVAVLLNAELEHVDYFRDLSQIEDSFFRFASLTGRDGGAGAGGRRHGACCYIFGTGHRGGRVCPRRAAGAGTADLYTGGGRRSMGGGLPARAGHPSGM